MFNDILTKYKLICIFISTCFSATVRPLLPLGQYIMTRLAFSFRMQTRPSWTKTARQSHQTKSLNRHTRTGRRKFHQSTCFFPEDMYLEWLARSQYQMDTFSFVQRGQSLKWKTSPNWKYLSCGFALRKLPKSLRSTLRSRILCSCCKMAWRAGSKNQL